MTLTSDGYDIQTSEEDVGTPAGEQMCVVFRLFFFFPSDFIKKTILKLALYDILSYDNLLN